MSRLQRLFLAEDVADNYGNLTIFVRTYTDYRQSYTIDTSIELALADQNLFEIYTKKLNTLDENSKVL